MTKSDRARKLELQKMLKENLIDSVKHSIKLELRQIAYRNKPKPIKCSDCNAVLENVNRLGRHTILCKECAKVRSIINGTRCQAKLVQCQSCPSKHPASYMVDHKGKLICGDCFRAGLTYDLTMDEYLESRTADTDSVIRTDFL